MIDEVRMSQAPWTPEEVANLNAYQEAGFMHPFTCGVCRANLVATEAGWTCANDDYTQGWAHRWMADGSVLESFRQGLGRMFGGEGSAR